jgi:hypothetical protein
MEDIHAWHFDPRGLFSVKSAYKVGVQLRDRRLGRDAACPKENLANSTVKFDWNHIWLPHNSLANRMKIRRLGVDLDMTCPVCHRLNENGGHVFPKCKKVKSVGISWL